jgi:hypothetical protein
MLKKPWLKRSGDSEVVVVVKVVEWRVARYKGTKVQRYKDGSGTPYCNNTVIIDTHTGQYSSSSAVVQ